MIDNDCIFCAIITGNAPAVIVKRLPDAIAIRPLRPVNNGHVLIMPTIHVPDYATDPLISAGVMARASQLADDNDSNIITSRGTSATQTVMHLHLHYVPRYIGDKLPLPWDR